MGISWTFGSDNRFPPTFKEKYRFRKSYLEQHCNGQFHYGDDCKGIIISEAIGTFLVCLVVGKELAGWRQPLGPFTQSEVTSLSLDWQKN